MNFDIVKNPDPILREISLDVKVFDKNLIDFMKSLLDTMYKEQGMGIAAIQVGNPIRALIIDVPKKEIDSNNLITTLRNPIFIINPEITYLSEEKIVLPEGCLSVEKNEDSENIKLYVERPKDISIKYFDIYNNIQELSFIHDNSEYDLWSARCLQHEIDHLNGILYIDKLYQDYNYIN